MNLLGGHIGIGTVSVPEMLTQHKAGKVRILGITADKRMELLPDVPTWKEQGVDIVCLAFMGTYMMNYSTFDFYLLVVFGCLGYVMRKLDIPIPPMVLALILGDTMEKTLRQALVATDGNPAVFLDKPIALVFFGLAALSLCYSLYQNKKMEQKRKAKKS